MESAELLGAWRELVHTARRTTAEGLVVGTSGNLSVRVGDTVLVTPSGLSYERLGDAELWAARSGPRRPTRHRRDGRWAGRSG